MMYTVAVFDGSPANESALMELTALINQRSSFEALERKRRGIAYACGICKDADWSTHVLAIDKFLVEHAEQVRSAVEVGVSITFDTAVDSTDISEGSLWTTMSYPAELVQRLAGSGAATAITLYQTESRHHLLARLLCRLRS